MIEMRYLKTSVCGIRLQYRFKFAVNPNTYVWSDWKDIPTVIEDSHDEA